MLQLVPVLRKSPENKQTDRQTDRQTSKQDKYNIVTGYQVPLTIIKTLTQRVTISLIVIGKFIGILWQKKQYRSTVFVNIAYLITHTHTHIDRSV